MSCPHQHTLKKGDDYKYSHDETATIRLQPSSKASTTAENGTPPWSLTSRVLIESTSSLRSSTPLFRRGRNDSWCMSEVALASGTPFSEKVLELLSRYLVRRLLVRVGDAAVRTGGIEEAIDGQHFMQGERSGGPSGTSIQVSFVQPTDLLRQKHYGNNQAKEYYRDKYASLLRYLLDKKFFPPCGAPLDSLRVRKHGHCTTVHSPNYKDGTQLKIQTVNFESFLAVDATTFCNPGIQLFILSKGGGWGDATNNGACHSSDTWGLFNSLFSSSYQVKLSELLLGRSMVATPRESGGGRETEKRNSVWIDLQVSPSCFATDEELSRREECLVKVTRGVSYSIALSSPSLKNSNAAGTDLQKQQQLHTLNVSLGDLLLGHNALQHSLTSEQKGWKTLNPCPYSDSSRILMYLPTGYGASLEGGTHMVSNDIDGDLYTGKMEFNFLALNDGYIDLATSWAELYRINEKRIRGRYLPAHPSIFGISRTVKRPLGVSSSGTLVMVIRYDQVKTLTSGLPNIVKVLSQDILPGTLMKPKMHTLRMILYQGGGAGGDSFVPSMDSDCDHCECVGSETGIPHSRANSDQRGSICHTHISLSKLHDHKLTLHPDGTILLERTLYLHPDSSLWMMLDFDEAHLPFQKYPADANRGVDVFPSRATFMPLTVSSPMAAMSSVTLYSPSLLLLPPVPDMSMPFNVISLSCTLWAFVLGSLLNVLVRRGTESIKREFTGKNDKRLLDKLNEKFQERIRKLKDKVRMIKKREGNQLNHKRKTC